MGLLALVLSNRRPYVPISKARNRAQHEQPQISPVNVPPRQIKRRGDQAQHAGKHERRSDGGAGGQSHDQHQRRNGEAAAADSGQPHRESDQKSDQIVH